MAAAVNGEYIRPTTAEQGKQNGYFNALGFFSHITRTDTLIFKLTHLKIPRDYSKKS